MGKKRRFLTLRGARGVVIRILLTAIFAFLYFFFELPAINLHNTGFYTYLALIVLVYTALTLLGMGISRESTPAEFFGAVKAHCRVPLIIIIALVAILLIGTIISLPIFNASRYSVLLEPESGDFAQDVAEISFDQIPMLDETSAQMLATRKLGELSDMVSQFEVDGESSQINLKDTPVRVTYLNYGGLVKWWNNRARGIPAYMLIDMVTQEVTVYRLESGIKYSPSELFFRDIDRYIRFKYPTLMFDDVNFEVDDEGHPYWVCSVITKTIGLFGGTDVIGAVVVDACTGESVYYKAEDVPTWVDRVYTAQLIIEQYNHHGKLQNGWLNSIFGQRNVTVTTDGYNYIAIDEDVWVYTGITSVGGDESNIGFILVNQRTKEAKYYPIAGAEEYSAMSSAQGVVQHLNYRATFPLLLNISGQPTYFMALKDNAQLVKMYAMANVQQYQIVATGATVVQCQENYRQLLANNNLAEDDELTEDYVEGVIADIRSGVLDGNTRYYIRLTGQTGYYYIDLSACEIAAILDQGDRVRIYAYQSEGELIRAISLEKLK